MWGVGVVIYLKPLYLRFLAYAVFFTFVPWHNILGTDYYLLQVVLLVYLWSRETEQDHLVHKPVMKWTAKEVAVWLEQLGQWTTVYKDRFLEEEVNGR